MHKELIVISTPYFFPGEASSLTLLLSEGVSHLHLRKPNGERDKLASLLERIPAVYHERIVLHDWFDLASERHVGGIHLNSRNPEPPSLFKGSVSRSCHSLAEVRIHKSKCDYLFLSPIFPSISKEGYGNGFSLEELREARGIIDSKVIALGGISPQTIEKLKGIPFGGVAVLGALWGETPALLSAGELIKRLTSIREALST